jgi:hypothetical protein
MYKMIGADGQQYGPVDAEQIRRWISENRVRNETLIQAEGSQEWKPLRSYPEFSNASVGNVPPPFSETPPPMSALKTDLSSRASTKVAAGVCGILLGSLGIHKFILGYTGPVTGIIGLIEGIIYLTKSDEEFVRTYVDGRKDWF